MFDLGSKLRSPEVMTSFFRQALFCLFFNVANRVGLPYLMIWLPSIKASRPTLFRRSKVNGQGHGVKNVENACKRDNSITVGSIALQFGTHMLQVDAKN